MIIAIGKSDCSSCHVESAVIISQIESNFDNHNKNFISHLEEKKI